MTSTSVRPRAARVVAALALAASMAACKGTSPATLPAEPPAPSTAVASARGPQTLPSAPDAQRRSVPVRPAGDAAYRLSITSDEGRGVSTRGRRPPS